jgi:hypothetical protein
MTGQPKRIPWISPEEYLVFERRIDYNREYSDGGMFAMSGVSPTDLYTYSDLTIVCGKSLAEYNIIAQDKQHIEHFVRQAASWRERLISH